MKKIKYSTKRGKALVESANRCTAKYLNQIYDSWSQAKQNAYDYCLDLYYASENHELFGIGNQNTFGFTARWFCDIDGEPVCRIETRESSYAVYLNQ